MKLLLDTHVLLWWFVRPQRIQPRVAKLIRSRSEAVWFSSASAWEIEIKRALGKLDVPDDLLEAAEQSHFSELSVTALHAIELRRLPLLHQDPFDRLLVAQARVQGLTLVTADEKVAAYPVPTLLALFCGYFHGGIRPFLSFQSGELRPMQHVAEGPFHHHVLFPRDNANACFETGLRYASERIEISHARSRKPFPLPEGDLLRNPSDRRRYFRHEYTLQIRKCRAPVEEQNGAPPGRLRQGNPPKLKLVRTRSIPTLFKQRVFPVLA